MSTRHISLLSMVLLLLPACAASRRQQVPDTPSSAPAASSDTSARGTVRVVGALPRSAVVLRADAREIVLVGPLAPELATLDGAEVTVMGTVGASPTPLPRGGRTITVREYEIDSVAGGKPVVGILVADDQGVRVDSVALVSAPDALRQLEGSKVWVVGERTGSGALRVEAYGVLRQAADTLR